MNCCHRRWLEGSVAGPLFLLLIVCFLTGCDRLKGEHVFEKYEDRRLEDTSAGAWIKYFEIDYAEDAQDIKIQIRDQLTSEGTHIVSFHHEENKNAVSTDIWQHKDLTISVQRFWGNKIWNGPTVAYSMEYHLGEIPLWIT